MPRKPINYKKVIIYKLVCNDLSVKDLYVGHTTDFTNRKRNHKNRCLNPNDSKHNYKVYKMIRENGDWNNWSMIEIEKYPCNDDNEARSRERYWYEVLNANLNMISPTLDVEKRKNYYENNKNKINDKQKEYYKKNKNEINDRHKDYYIRNKDKRKDYLQEKHQCLCGGCFTTANKSQHSKTKRHLKYIQENESE